MGASDQDNEDFQSIPKRTATKKRLYVGNLPVGLSNDELEEKLIALFQESGQCSINRSDIAIQSSKSCHAFVTISGNFETVIKKLNRTQFGGRRIIVQRERKRKELGQAKKPGFSGAAWSRPSLQDNERGLSEQRSAKEQKIQEVLTEELQNSTDPVGTAIAATAAVGIVAADEDANVSDDGRNESTDDFMIQSKKSLSELMADYGEQDLNWKQVQPTTIDEEEEGDAAQTSSPPPANRLTKHGKAPIHVEFSSFGYFHGAPAELRNGWSHAQPLAVFDCRDLEPVPHYLAWQSGLSGAVKRALMFPRRNGDDKEDEATTKSPSIRKVAREVAENVATKVVEAIEEGGHGYAMPLQMVVYVGSESGRHRSVVLCELAATALRKLLRSNKDNRFTQPCSVGTRHRDLDRNSAKALNSSAKLKQRDLEDD